MTDSGGATLLCLAAFYGRLKTVEFLLNRSKEKINEGNKKGLTPLLLAAFGGHEDVARLLIAHGTEIHLRTRGDTSLTSAVKQGHWAVVDLLMTHDPSIARESTNDGETPLHLAVSRNHFDIVKLLLDFGCDPTARSTRTGDSLLHLVAGKGHFITLELVLKYAGQFVNDKNTEGMTPLLIAAKAGFDRTVRTVLNYSREKDIPLTELIVETSQHYSVLCAAAEGGSSTIVRKVLEFLPDINIAIQSMNRQG